MTPAFTTAADLFGGWLAEVERWEPPARFRLPAPFAALDVRLGRLLIFGGAPCGGKTAGLVQIGVDLLRRNDAARPLVANVEMAPGLLAERMVARLAAVPLTALADRTPTADQLGRVRAAVNALGPVSGRPAFLHAPFALEHVAAAGQAFGANVLMLDYVQRFTVRDGGGTSGSSSNPPRSSSAGSATWGRRSWPTGAAAGPNSPAPSTASRATRPTRPVPCSTCDRTPDPADPGRATTDPTR